MSQLTDYLRMVHLDAGLPSTRSLARMTEMSHSTIADALSGRRTPSWSKLERIVSALGGSPIEAKRLWKNEVGMHGGAMTRFIRISFERGISQADYDRLTETVMDLAEAMVATYPEDCDNEIFVSGGGAVEEKEMLAEPQRPYGPGAFCDSCGHFASRHGPEGCMGFPDKPCRCPSMLWNGYRWPRPWLGPPEGLRPA